MVNNNPEDYSVADLRRMMVEKRRGAKRQRLAHYQKTGRLLGLNEGITEEGEDYSFLKNPPQRSFGQRIFNGTLLLVEIFAVGAVLFVFFVGMDALKNFNQEVARSFELPAPSPTPLLIAAVLPSGHTPPTSPGGARPNDAEIPEHLRPLVQSLANIPIPTPSPEHAIRVQIPAINVDAPVVQGTGWEQLKKGIGQFLGSSNPGEKGNMVFAAHNDVYGEIFRFLDQLEPGDRFTVFTNLRAYTYVITGWEIVEPTQVEAMNPTPDATATLISCYPYLIDTQRIVVKAKLIQG